LSKNTWANRARKWWRQPMTGCIWPMYISSEQCIASVWADVRQHSFWNVLALIAHQYTLWNWKTVLKMGFFFFSFFFPFILSVLIFLFFFFFLARGVRTSLRAPQLIFRSTKHPASLINR
jgi:amino acid transporter